MLLELQIFESVIVFLVIISIGHLTQVFLKIICISIFIAAISIDNINSIKLDEAFLAFLFLFIFLATILMVFFFLFNLLSLSRYILRDDKLPFLNLGLKIFNSKIFQKVDLVFSFFKLKMVTLEVILVSPLNIKMMLKS